MPSRLLSSFSLAILLAAAPASAEPRLYRGDYSLSYLGLTVARTSFESRVDENSYSIKGSVSSAGLAAIFDDTKGTLSATGTFSGERTLPGRFRADYTSGKKATVVDILFSGGNVTKTTNIPPLRKRGGDWVPLGGGDLKGVADPIAATLIRSDTLEGVCGRTSRMYDGELRADLPLRFISTGTTSIAGAERPSVTCAMGFRPVSGYRKGRRALEFLRDRSGIQVTFAQLGQTGVYAPVYATIGTEIGTITLRARQFEAVQ